MGNEAAVIPIIRLGFMLIPITFICWVLYRWSLAYHTALYAFARMLVQLLLVGYALNYIFAVNYAWTSLVILTLMLVIAGWIALRPLSVKTGKNYLTILFSVTLGSLISLGLVTQLVLEIQPWFSVRHVIPLAGIIVANAMNTVSLAAERFAAEMSNTGDYQAARHTALNAALIPIINMLFAVGIVSLPGFMTGQILSGIEPLIAVRYQIMVMAMLFSASGIAAICYLHLCRGKGG